MTFSGAIIHDVEFESFLTVDLGSPIPISTILFHMNGVEDDPYYLVYGTNPDFLSSSNNVKVPL